MIQKDLDEQQAKVTEMAIIITFIMSAIKKADCNDMTQIHPKVKLRDGKMIVSSQWACMKRLSLLSLCDQSKTY